MTKNKQYTIYFISKAKKRATKFIEEELKKRGINDLSHSHGSILSVLYKNDNGLKMKEIANLIGKNKSTVTELVNKLVKLGYIKKEKSQADKRVTLITLTDKGKGIRDIFDAISQNLIETAYQDFSKEEEETFLRLLKKLYTNFE